MYKVITILAVCFFGFILWVIYQANTASSSIFLDFVRSLPYGDKIGHAGLFGTLTFLAVVGSKFRCMSISRFKVYYGSLAVAIFVIGEEISQAYIPSRTFDFIDLAADFVGILGTTGLAYLISKQQLHNQALHRTP